CQYVLVNALSGFPIDLSQVAITGTDNGMLSIVVSSVVSPNSGNYIIEMYKYLLWRTQETCIRSIRPLKLDSITAKLLHCCITDIADLIVWRGIVKPRIESRISNCLAKLMAANFSE